jgi:lipid A ethanolaminephosphotransferase
VSDHGESLGENGIFLHALPYAVAPEVQTHVPMLFWASPGFATRMGLDMKCVASQKDRELSHDNLLHSVLGLLNIETQVIRAEQNLVARC